MNSAEVFFSIIIPTYNRADKISRAIKSVLNQTFTSFEIIVIDDGSTDNSREVVIGIKDERIKYFKKKNEERGIARNFGISKAQGKYIGFLDSDDYYYPNHLSIARKCIKEKGHLEVIHLGYEVRVEDGTLLYKKNNLSNNIEEQLILENPLSCNGIIIRRDILKKYRFIPSKEVVVGEDYYLWLKLAARYTIFCNNSITSVIVEHEKRSIKDIKPDKLVYSIEEIIKQLKEDEVFLEKYRGMVKFYFSNCYTLIALSLALTKDRRLDTILYLFKAVQQDIFVIGRRRFLASIKHWF